MLMITEQHIWGILRFALCTQMNIIKEFVVVLDGHSYLRHSTYIGRCILHQIFQVFVYICYLNR